MSFDDVLLNGIPLHEASRFFLQLTKTADQPTEPPDETGELEGQFCAPLEQVLAAMGKQVQGEFETHMSYKVYAQTLRGLAHNSIAEEFEAHASEEMDHADFLLKRMAALGGPAHVPDVQAPPASANPEDIIRRMIRMEQEAVSNWRNLRCMMGDNNPSAIAVDDYMLKELEHIDDLWQLLPHTERPMNPAPPMPEAAAVSPEAPPPEAPAPEAPAPAASEKKAPDLAKAAAAMKQAYYDDPYYRSGYHYDPYAAQMAQHMQDKATVEGLQGRLRQAGSPAHQEAIKQQFMKDQIDEGRIGGALTGGLLGGGLGVIPGVAKGSLPLAAVGGVAGAGLGGWAGHGLGKMHGKSRGKDLTDRAYAGMLPTGPSSTPAAGVEEAAPKADPALPKTANVVPEMASLKNELPAVAQGIWGRGKQLLSGGRVSPLKQHVESLPGRVMSIAGDIGKADPSFDRRALQSAVGDVADHAHSELLKEQAKVLGSRAAAVALPVAGAAGIYGATRDKTAAWAMRFVKAANEMMGGAPASTAPMDMMGLQQEQIAQEAQDQNEADFYRQKAQEAQQQLQAAQQTQQQTQQQLDQLNQQMQGMQGQIDGAMQQAQQTQQQATQNAQAAQAAATQAMQQSMTANSELLSQQQLASNMRNAYQQLQQQVMSVAQNAPPPPATTMEAGLAQAQPMQPGTGMGMEQQAGMPPDQGGEEATGAGQPGGEVGGQPPPGPGSPGDQGPDGVAAPAENTQPTMAQAAPQSEQTAPSPEAGMMGPPKQASALEQYLAEGVEQAKKHAPQLIGAGIGAAGGAALPFALKGGEEELAALRQRVAEQEANKDELGWQQELGLIKNKAQLGLEEMSQKHPAAAHILGAATGASAGALGGSVVGNELKKHKLLTTGY